MVLVTAADVSDLAGAKQLLKGSSQLGVCRIDQVGFALLELDSAVDEATGRRDRICGGSAALGRGADVWLVHDISPPVARQ